MIKIRAMPAAQCWTDTQLAAAVERNHIERLRWLGQLPWVELRDDGDALLLFAGDSWPQNQVAQARFGPENVQARIGDLLTFHLKQKVACNWVVGPESEPADLARHLRGHGFHCMIHCAGMACRLERLKAKPKLDRGVRVEETVEPPPLQPLTTERRRKHHHGLCELSQIRPQRQWIFAAHADGKPAGKSVLLAGAGVAGIYGVEVLERFRRRGIGTALVYAALQKARQQGFQVSVLSATGMGRSIYDRLGFGEVGRLSFWKYGKMRQL